MSKRYFCFVFVAMCHTSLSGCAILTYDVKPEAAWKAPNTAISQPELFYRIDEVQGISFGGEQALRESILEKHFSRAEFRPEPPPTGAWLRVSTQWLPPSIASLVWGYIALSTLFILPAYSDTSGFVVRYLVYRDQKLTRTYEYEIHRTGFAWLPVLAVVWVNALTASEKDAFKAVTRQFFADASRDGAL